MTKPALRVSGGAPGGPPEGPAAKGRPECPARFDDETRAEWGRLCDHLEAAGKLDPGHGFALSLYCSAYSRLLKAEEALDEHGPLLIRPGGVDDEGNETPPVIKSNPAATIAARCESQMARILAEFGLTPASAPRVKGAAAEKRDKFSEYLQRKGRGGK